MTMTNFNLLANKMNGDYSYSITVEEAPQQLVRLVVSCTNESSNEKLFQGIDLTAEECDILGKYLIVISEHLSKYTS